MLDYTAPVDNGYMMVKLTMQGPGGSGRPAGEGRMNPMLSSQPKKAPKVPASSGGDGGGFFSGLTSLFSK
eukprot:g67811.t1